MSLYETKSAIADIASAAQEYQSSISSLRSELSMLTGNIDSIGNSIKDCVMSDAIVDYSMNVGNEITSSINNCLSLIDSAASTVKDDANRKISELISSYNSQNSRLEKDKREEYLSYGDFCI